MNVFQGGTGNLCGEIVGRILVLMQINSASEAMSTGSDNPVFVILFDKTGSLCEYSVHKVAAVGEEITFEVHGKIIGENYKVTNRHEAALTDPTWLNDILGAMASISHIKEDSIIYYKYGDRDVTCEAMIDPNTKNFDHYTDDSFQYGWCNNCRPGAVVSGTSEVRKRISQKCEEFKNTYNTEPQLALCHIMWKGGMEETEVPIALENTPEEHDGAIFPYCDSLSDFTALAGYGGGNFAVTECFGFTGLRSEE